MNRASISLSLLAVVLFACSEILPPPSEYSYTVPADVGDGWQTADLSQVGLQVDRLEEMVDRISDGSYTNIHSVLIVRDDRLVLEEYFPGTTTADQRHVDWTMAYLHEVHSVTKSVSSILIGIAIDKGFISGVDEKVSTFFPEHAGLFADEPKASLTLRHFLTMTAGLQWDEKTYSYSDARNSHVQLSRSPDPVRFALALASIDEPGRSFRYNSGLSIVLGEVVQRATGLPADAFAEQYLFGPLGITDYSWYVYPDGTVQTGGGLALRPRDMARIGLLYLNQGFWEGGQIVSAEWVHQSTISQQSTTSTRENYGFQWWIMRLPRHDNVFDLGAQVVESPAANGRGGQWIFIYPEHDLVVVFTGGNDNELAQQPLDIVRRFIFSAGLF